MNKWKYFPKENGRKSFKWQAVTLILTIILFTPLLASAGRGQHYSNALEAKVEIQ